MPQSVNLPGMTHNAPIPSGSRVANVLCSSGISGKDLSTSLMPDDPREQARLAFENLKLFLQAGGATPEDVVKVTVYIKEESMRAHVNVHWCALWPDPSHRPARHTLLYELGHGMALQLEVMAVMS